MSFLIICLTRLICPRADIQDDAVLIMWSLNESLLSNTTPRSLTESTGKSSLPKRVRRKSWSFDIICRLPYTISLVLSGFRSSLLLKHQLRSLKRSSFIVHRGHSRFTVLHLEWHKQFSVINVAVRGTVLWDWWQVIGVSRKEQRTEDASLGNTVPHKQGSERAVFIRTA